MGTTAGQFIEELARRHRVLVIGGLAVIAHGFNRPTKDADVWLEQVCSQFAGLTVHTLPGWRLVAGREIATAAEEGEMVRVLASPYFPDAGQTRLGLASIRPHV